MYHKLYTLKICKVLLNLFLLAISIDETLEWLDGSLLLMRDAGLLHLILQF